MLAIFDEEASGYDSWYESKLGSFADMVETRLAFEMLKPENGQKILDAGCGTGNFSCKLALKGCIVTGIDISRKMLGIAKSKATEFGAEIDFREMDIYKLDFPNEYFDAALSMAAFEFVQFPERALNELFRVVKKGGNILAGTINGDSKWGELYLNKHIKEKSVYRHARFKTPEDMQKLRGDNLVDIRQCLFIPPDINEKCLSLGLENKLSATERGGFICALWRK